MPVDSGRVTTPNATTLLSSLPESLRKAKCWLVWKFHPPLEGKTKERKVPYYALRGTTRHGSQGSEPDRAGLVNMDQAIKVAKSGGYSGIGIALLDDLPFSAVDFDNCLTDGKLNRPELRPILNATYCEVSPSGKGLRLLYSGKLGVGGSIKNIKGGVELFDSTGFVTVTGQRAGKDVGVNRVSDAHRTLLKGMVTDKAPATNDPDDFGQMESLGKLQRYLDALLPEAYQDRDQWLRVGMAVHKATGGSDVGKAMWDKWSRQATENYGGVDPAWKSFKTAGNAAGAVGAATLAYMAQNPATWASGATTDDPLGVGTGAAPLAADPWPPLIFLADPSGWDQQPPPKQALFEGLMPHGELGALAGMGGAGKSWLTLQMAVAVGVGMPLCGEWEPASEIVGKDGAPCLMLNAEDSAEDFWRRTHALAHEQVWGDKEWAMFKRNVHIAPVAGKEKNMTKVVNGVMVAHTIARRLVAAVMERGYRLVVVDPAIYFRAGDENDAMAQATFMDALAPVCCEGQCTVMVVQHVNKGTGQRAELSLDDMRGSTALGGAVRWAAIMRGMTLDEQAIYPVGDDERRSYVQLSVVKNSHGTAGSHWLHRAPMSGALSHQILTPITVEQNPTGFNAGRPRLVSDTAILQSMRDLPDQTQAELGEQLGVSQSTLSRRLRSLQSAGLIDEHNRPIDLNADDVIG